MDSVVKPATYRGLRVAHIAVQGGSTFSLKKKKPLVAKIKIFVSLPVTFRLFIICSGCHSGDCEPCSQSVAVVCFCTASRAAYTCRDWNSLTVAEQEKRRCCSQRYGGDAGCPKSQNPAVFVVPFPIERFDFFFAAFFSSAVPSSWLVAIAVT